MYNNIGLTLLQIQKEKVNHAYQNKAGVTLKLNASQLNGSDFLGLTKTQLNKIKKQREVLQSNCQKHKFQNKEEFFWTILAILTCCLIPSLFEKKGLVLLGSNRKGLVLLDQKRKGLSKKKFYYFEKPVLAQGLILGPNSPFKNILILGLIL